MWEFVKTAILLGMIIAMPFLAIFTINVCLTDGLAYNFQNWFFGMLVCLFTRAIEFEV